MKRRVRLKAESDSDTKVIKGRRGKKYSWGQVIIEYLGGVCTYCNGKKKLDIHHIIPLERGGAHSLGNLEVACASCHYEIHRVWERIAPRKKNTLFICGRCESVGESMKSNKRFCSRCSYLRRIEMDREKKSLCDTRA